MATERPKVKFDDNGEVIVTTKVLCQILDLGPEMISRHNRAGMPKVATGWWNVREVLVWLGMSKETRSRGGLQGSQGETRKANERSS